MSASISSKARAVPVISVDKIKPLIENFLLSISLDQSMDLALGQPDGDTKSKLKELLLNLVQEYSTFVLYNIRKRRMRSVDVAAVVGDSLLKSFADVLEINGKTHPKSFECFHELFVKQIKEKVRSSFCCMDDQAASFVLQIVAVNTVDSMLPHTIKMMKKLLVWKCKEDRQTVEQKAIQNPQKEGRKRRFGKSSRKYHHGRYRLLPVIPEEPELEEATAEGTDKNNCIFENQESDLKMVDEFITDEISKMPEEPDICMPYIPGNETWQLDRVGVSCHCLVCGVYSSHGDQSWNLTSVRPTSQAMTLGGRFMPLPGMWGSRFLYAPHGTMSLVRRFVLLPGIWGHTDVIVAQCWYPTSVIPTCQPMSQGGSFVPLPGMWCLQLSW
ncbi:hypothetical protein XENOCAPTIV_025345 [Xenoophorus captivus]|uniref:Uncharacterized protein n=1 Tax=Xenoophorus captivus TaxID=1517983 RepID=A0ABV0QEF8_9TELE